VHGSKRPLIITTMQELNQDQILNDLTTQDYQYGFTTDVEPMWLRKDWMKMLSGWFHRKGRTRMAARFSAEGLSPLADDEAAQLGAFKDPGNRLSEYHLLCWSHEKKSPQNLDEVDPELLKTFERLGIPLEEQKQLTGVAVDAVMDSVSIKTTFKDVLAEKGIIFSSFSDAVKHHPDLVRKYLGTVVPYKDNFYAALNSAVFSDGSFVYIPKGVRCPMELSTYFVLIPPILVSLNEHLSWPTMTHMLATSRDVPLLCAMKINCMQLL